MAAVTFQGLASGIDGAAVSDALVKQLTLQNKPRQAQVDSQISENKSLETLSSKLSDIATVLDKLRTSNGGAGSLEANSSDSSVVKATADSSAVQNSFAVSVESIAKNAAGSFNQGFGFANEFVAKELAQTGDLNFKIGSGDNQKNFTVTVGEFTTAQGLVDKFNQAAEGSAKATLVNLGTSSSPNYKISFASAGLGTEKGAIEVSSSNDLLLTEALGGATVDQATNAKFSIGGIAGTFERDSNKINDAVSGVSLELSGAGVATVNVGQNSSASAKQLEDFVSAYNELVNFVSKESAVTPTQKNGESVNVYGSLAKTSIDNDSLSALRGVIAGASSADKTLSLASLGIATERDGTLSFDKAKFEQAFAENPTKANEAITNLADRVAGVDGVVSHYTGYNRGIDRAIAVNEEQIAIANQTIEKVERNAASRGESLMKQFSSLEGLISRLNSQSGIITQLLQF